MSRETRAGALSGVTGGQMGKLIGAVVQMLAPALSSHALDADAPEATVDLLGELRDIRALLEAQPRAAAT